MFISGFEKRAKELIHGGKADGRSSPDFPKDQMEMGKKVEREHTDNPQIAEEIARDHLTEDKKYYTHLKEMEDKYVKKEASVGKIDLPLKKPYKDPKHIESNEVKTAFELGFDKRAAAGAVGSFFRPLAARVKGLTGIGQKLPKAQFTEAKGLFKTPSGLTPTPKTPMSYTGKPTSPSPYKGPIAASTQPTGDVVQGKVKASRFVSSVGTPAKIQKVRKGGKMAPSSGFVYTPSAIPPANTQSSFSKALEAGKAFAKANPMATGIGIGAGGAMLGSAMIGNNKPQYGQPY